jgi:murein DD-endopeptidase MepM/ murein hydrolase activator NlpD
VSGRIETSLFEDGQQAGLSDALILKLVEIFGWDVDFALGVRRGDSFAVVHEAKYWLGQKAADGPILAAKFVNRGVVYQAIGFRDANGVTTYYEPNGLTKKQLFLRTPIEFSRISSRYTATASRFHPILKIWTAHRGVDYAAPTSTPIRATAKGRINAIGWNGGYGKSIVIKHDDGPYNTLYAHLSRYAYNPSNPKTHEFREGSPVEQGQIIGYVGQTGLATGPHLHYEFRLNEEHRDPLRLKFPSTGVISDEQRGAFVAHTQSLLAQLDLIADRHLAANR